MVYELHLLCRLALDFSFAYLYNYIFFASLPTGFGKPLDGFSSFNYFISRLTKIISVFKRRRPSLSYRLHFDIQVANDGVGCTRE